MFGYTQEEMLALKSWHELIAEVDRHMVATHVQQRASGAVPSAQYVFRGLRKDGTVIEVDVLGKRGALHGRPAVMGTLLDVTERRRVEAARQRLIAILEATPDLDAFASGSGSSAALARRAFTGRRGPDALRANISSFHPRISRPAHQGRSCMAYAANTSTTTVSTERPAWSAGTKTWTSAGR
jgi:PAS domain S-box-containing protein